MEINKTYRFKLKLNSTQTATIEHYINVCRLVYNLAKETKEYVYKAYSKNLSCYELQKQLTDLRSEYPWIKDVPVHTLQDVLERLDKTYKAFFKGGGYPKWAGKHKYKSITFKDVKVDTYNRIKLPKIGSVKYFASRSIEGKLQRATITKESDGYYISIITRQVATPNTSVPYDSQVGIDLGVAHFAITSDGVFYPNPQFHKQQLRKLRIEQRSLDRKKKLSSNWIKQKKRIGKLQKKIARQRKDHLHKVSTEIANQYSYVVVEDLKTANMAKSAKGTIENPGKNVKAKSGLNRSILDSGWGMFAEMLNYKLTWNGGELITVNPAYTSQTCSSCGHQDKGNRKSQAEFKCVSCGFESNADANASKNILGLGKSYVTQRKALA